MKWQRYGAKKEYEDYLSSQELKKGNLRNPYIYNQKEAVIEVLKFNIQGHIEQGQRKKYDTYIDKKIPL